MKASIKATGMEDFLKDVSDFLERTLSKEQLSQDVLEHRTRLVTRLNALLDECKTPCNLYMDMTIDPSIRSFFITDSSSSSTSTEKLIESPRLNGVHPVNSLSISAVSRTSSETTDNELLKSETGSSQQGTDVNNSKKKQNLFSKFPKFGISLKKKSTTDQVDCTPIPSASGDSDLYDDVKGKDHGGGVIYDEIGKVEAGTIYDDISKPILHDDVRKPNLQNINDRANANQISARIVVPIGIPCPLADAESDPIYDDLLPNRRNQFTDCSIDDGNVIYDDIKTSNNLGDRDNISVVSKSSCAVDPSLQISPSVANNQSICSGFLKRRSSKILASWRQCYAVLLPRQLLLYSTFSDNKPKECIDLQEGQFLVRLASKQGSDAKRVKMEIFQLLKNEKLLYEFSTGNREEAERWLSGLRSILSQAPEIGSDEDSEDDQLYDVPKFAQNGNRDCKSTKAQSSLAVTDAVYDDAGSVKTNAKPDQPKQRKNSKFTLFNFKRQNENSSTNIETEPSISKSQSEENSQETNDIYEDLPSPTSFGTPYASTISLNSQEEIYDDISSVVKGSDEQTSPIKSEAKWPLHSRSCSVDESASSSRSGFSRIISVSDTSNVYDTPPTSARPVAEAPQTESFLSQISNHILSRKSLESDVSNTSTDKVHVISHEQEVYDTPTSNRPISDSSLEETYDEVSSPPRAVREPTEKTTKQLAQFWVSKVNSEQNKQTSKKSEIHTKVAIETKSVGRSFTKVHIERPSLKSLTDSNSTFAQALGNLKPTKINDKSLAKTDRTQNAKKTSVGTVHQPVTDTNKVVNRKSTERETTAVSNVIKQFSNLTTEPQSQIKKQPPPRPPAPASVRFVSSQQQQFHNSLLGANADNDRKQPVEVASENVSEKKSLPTKKENSKDSKQYRSRWAYVAQNNLEISLNTGEQVEILTKAGPSWLVRSKNKTGLVPKEYLIPVP